MNNCNGAALLERIKRDALVTIRAANGDKLTGRAAWHPAYCVWYLRRGHGFLHDRVTADNVLAVRP